MGVYVVPHIDIQARVSGDLLFPPAFILNSLLNFLRQYAIIFLPAPDFRLGVYVRFCVYVVPHIDIQARVSWYLTSPAGFYSEFPY